MRRSITFARSLRALAPKLAILFLIAVGAASGRTASAATNSGATGAVSLQASPVGSFAIADFDGDARPDVATVERASSSLSDYWLRLELSKSGPQSIRFLAPPEGLAIEARDVNGDHAIDLVLVTAFLRRPVAVFLNDGHGRFSKAEPAAFPDAFAAPASNSVSSSDHAGSSLALLSSQRFDVRPETTRLPDVRGPTDSILCRDSRFVPDSFLGFEVTRAPPLQIPQL